jgi:serine/threonine-protein kinase
MTSERTAVTRIDPNSQQTVASTPAPAPGAEVPRPTIPEVELQAEIGRGGMGVVYRGRQTYLDRNVAVKLLLVDRAAADDEYVKRFQREAKILAGLSHPHIVACYSAGITADRHPYLVMEFIDGPNLKHWIAEHGPLKPGQALRVVRELAQALGHAYQHGIIHRDVKPENVLLMKREGGSGDDPSDFPFQAKLVDLGLARPQGTGSDMNLTGTGQVMGTPTTMAPEQFDDPEGVDFRADIYGLGCVLYHALIGRPAFEGRTLAQIVTAKVSGVAPNPTAVVTGLSPAIGQLVADMLAKNREARPQSYDALIARCDALIGGKPPAGGSGSLPWLVIGGVGVAAAVVLGVLIMPKQTPAGADLTVSTPSSTTPVSVAAPVAPPVPAPATLGEPELLWRLDVGNRLKDWTVAEGARWVASEATDHGIAGVAGRISRPLDPGPWQLSATLVPADGEDGKTERVWLGIVLGNGESVYVRLTNLSTTGQLMVERAYPDPKAAPANEVNSQIPPGRLTLELTYAGRFLRISYNGTPFDRAIGLSAEPAQVYLETVGEAPVEVHDLTIRRPVAK